MCITLLEQVGTKVLDLSLATCFQFTFKNQNVTRRCSLKSIFENIENKRALKRSPFPPFITGHSNLHN